VAPTSAVNLLQRRVTPSRNGSCALTGISVLVTGVDADARQRCAILVQRLGGTLLADVPTTAEVRLGVCLSSHWPLPVPFIHPGSHGSGLPSAYDHIDIALYPDANAVHHLIMQAAEGAGGDSSAEVVVVSDRSMRTLKYVYAVAAGHAVVKPSWLEVRLQALHTACADPPLGLLSTLRWAACDLSKT